MERLNFVSPAHVALRMLMLQVLASQLQFLTLTQARTFPQVKKPPPFGKFKYIDLINNIA